MTICVRLQCNMCTYLCTGGGDTYFLCAVYNTECTYFDTAESTNNWDFLTLFFSLFFLSVLLLLWLLQVYFVAFHIFLFSNSQHSNIRTHCNALLLISLHIFTVLLLLLFLSFHFVDDVDVVVDVVVVVGGLYALVRSILFFPFFLVFLLALEFIVSFCSCAQTYFCNSILKRDNRLIYKMNVYVCIETQPSNTSSRQIVRAAERNSFRSSSSNSSHKQRQ